MIVVRSFGERSLYFLSYQLLFGVFILGFVSSVPLATCGWGCPDLALWEQSVHSHHKLDVPFPDGVAETINSAQVCVGSPTSVHSYYLMVGRIHSSLWYCKTSCSVFYVCSYGRSRQSIHTAKIPDSRNCSHCCVCKCQDVATFLSTQYSELPLNVANPVLSHFISKCNTYCKSTPEMRLPL